MNFLRSGLFSETEGGGAATEPEQRSGGDGAEEEGEAAAPASGWSLGTLVKTVGKFSGEVIQSYKHDLTEFADGLKKESEIVREVTVDAVKDLPQTLGTGAVVAQESLESVGQSLEEFGGSIWRGTSELIATVKEAVQKVDEESAAKAALSRDLSSPQVSSSWKYSRYEAQVIAMQRDSSTYCNEPEGEEDYVAWRAGFDLSEKKAEIDALLKENAFMQELEGRIVPQMVDYDTFWTRYYFRLHKLQQVEDARADLVKRATASADEELSWEVEEDSVDDSRAGPDGARAARATGEEAAAADEAVVADSPQKEHSVRFEEDSSGPAPPPGDGRKSEQGEEVAAEHPAVGHDEGSVSEGSTGSDWLVVAEDNHAAVDASDKATPSGVVAEKESLAAAQPRPPAVDKTEPVSEGIEQLPTTAGDSPPASQKEAGKRKDAVGTRPIAEEPEDWGDWE